MSLKDVLRLSAGVTPTAHTVDAPLGLRYGGPVLNDRLWIIVPDTTAIPHLLVMTHSVRLSDVLGRDAAELWDPSTDEGPLRILVRDLLDRRINPHRVDAGRAALHLELAIVYAGLVVQELPRKVKPSRAPMQPEMVGREGDHHGAHPKVKPPRRI